LPRKSGQEAKLPFAGRSATKGLIAAIFAAALIAGAAPGIVTAASAESVILLPQPRLPVIPPVGHAPERPAMHSYQPYSNLQSGFRPHPPAKRGEEAGPQVIMPKRQAPMVGEDPAAAKWYSYCGSHAESRATSGAAALAVPRDRCR
jgi:hypothetical protein